jgi:NAD(P)-dependent dehydrogenase (short-subunit alcohol dehydrogenase family)
VAGIWSSFHLPLFHPGKDRFVFDLQGKSALVTGAGSGIGREIALLFATQGATVAVADINESGRTAVAEEITDAGGKAFPLHLDVTKHEDAYAAVAEILRAENRLDILVNNAGIGMVGDLLETSPEDFQRLIDVNVHGVYNCSQAAVNQMLKQDPQGGVIVNIASVAGQVAVGRRFAYGTTKGAVISMTQSVAMDYVDKGIRCNAICPGTVESPFVEAYLQRYHQGEIEETRKALHARQPIGRMGRPDEIAPLALYLAADESAFVTGAQFAIDGGWTAR